MPPTLAALLKGVQRVYVDSGAFIDYAEAAPRSIKPLTALWQQIQAGTLLAVTSTVTLPDVLREAHQSEGYDALLAMVQLVPVSEAVGREAATLRVTYGLDTVDALHTATAVQEGCGAIVTADASDMRRLSGLLTVIVPHQLAH